MNTARLGLQFVLARVQKVLRPCLKRGQGWVVWHLFPVYVAWPVLPKLMNSCPVGSDPEAQLRMPDVMRICLRCAAFCATLSGWNLVICLDSQWVWTRLSARNLMLPRMHSACWGSMLSHLEKHIKQLYSWMIKVAGFTVGIMREPSLSWQRNGRYGGSRPSRVYSKVHAFNQWG